jgi:TolB-like protein
MLRAAIVVCAGCGPSTAAMHVRVYASSDQVAACDDLGQVSGHASGWGDRFRLDAENDARENALKLGADAVRVTGHEAGFSGHTVTAEAYRCSEPVREQRAVVASKTPPPSLPKAARLLVLDFRVFGADARLGQIVTSMVSAELQRVRNLTVIARADIEAELGADKQRSLLGCDDTSCLADLAGALDTRFLVYGSIGAIGSQYAVSGNLFDSRANVARVRFSRTVGSSEDNLVALIPELTAELARGMMSE